MEAKIPIEGMSCGHCVRTVRGALESVSGVEVVEVEIGSATIRFDSSETSTDAIVHAIDETGFEVVRPLEI